MLRVYKPYISLRGCIWDIGYNIRVHLIDAGPSLEEGIGRAGEVSCDLVTHDYLHIPGGMLDIGEEILAATGNVEVYTPTAEKFCGRSLSGLAIQEFAEKIKVNDPLGAQDNNTIATPVTCKYSILYIW